MGDISKCHPTFSFCDKKSRFQIPIYDFFKDVCVYLAMAKKMFYKAF